MNSPFTLLVVAACVLLSYVVGALPFGVWVGLARGVDIRTVGSGNIGFTNVYRVLGPGPGALVFLLDTLKGTVGIVAARFALPFVISAGAASGAVAPHPAGAADFYHMLVLIGLCAVLGHTLSPFLRFKGGKGVATSLGILLALDWRVALIGLGLWIFFVAITRYVSVASLIAAFSLPFSSWFLLAGTPRWWMFGMTAALCVFVTIKHRENIQRLLQGTESKFGQRVPAAVSEETTHV